MKRGMLAYAYSRKIPVQVSHHAGIVLSCVLRLTCITSNCMVGLAIC